MAIQQHLTKTAKDEQHVKLRTWVTTSSTRSSTPHLHECHGASRAADCNQACAGLAHDGSPAAPADFAALAVAAAAGHAIPLRVPAVALLHLW
eukprot:1158330-Pelagomonas_calceolata.AAC.3